ncbi:UPF0326 protein hag1 [Xylona heveae TC161]|uniref:UPF0326 protein hag1 n=1 Tax=Xylona heveae (strain CBS 132557 / TC161) TaxID=1328760 RepID=A0A164Z8G6_XYLHT|nr:UPF0326 protein hag1 [Xylona heveae TC161]KZF18815.1 UPF0326 protein hag1 [Xylona heveae TC161]
MDAPKRKASQKASGNHRTTLSLKKTEICINVYDLLPPGKLSSILWTIGGSLLHSGVVIGDKEYAYGGHDRPGMSGVYWTKPRMEPPGGTFRCEILHGFTIRPDSEIDSIVKEASQKFQGTSYNLLTNNCNHFTSYLCQQLTSRPAPAWLNRAASIGLALPCVVPREWIAPPDHDTADGELLEEEDDDERAHMLSDSSRRRPRPLDDELASDVWDSDQDRRNGGSGKGKATIRDSSGRTMPVSERAPPPHRH